MAFSFGFASDDIDLPDAAAAAASDEEENKDRQMDDNKLLLGDDDGDRQTGSQDFLLLPTRRHTLEDLLSSLPSRLSYGYLPIPVYDTTSSDTTRGSKTLVVARRALFDIRAQLMAEAAPDLEGDNRNDDLLSGLNRGDLTSGVYEGGFKTWECAVDLAGFVAGYVARTSPDDISDEKDEKDENSYRNHHIIELGAGSAVPSLLLVAQILRSRRGITEIEEETNRVKFTLCDYNEDVLRLVTVPNLLLAWWETCGRSGADRATTDKDEPGAEKEHEAELEDIDGGLTSRFVEDCGRSGIVFDFVSGAWGREFVDLITRGELEDGRIVDNGDGGRQGPLGERGTQVLILASETIYSPSSLGPFTDTVVELLRHGGQDNAKALIAAKKVYFGVGGGVQEFMLEMRTKGGEVETVLDVREAGVGRVVQQVTLSQSNP